jgi:O-antigen/teichoic acid export membrane protein
VNTGVSGQGLGSSSAKPNPLRAGLGRTMLIIAAANALIAGLATLGSIIAAHRLGRTVRGELAAAQSIGSFVALIAMFGVSEAIVYLTARHPDASGSILLTGATLAALGCAIAIPLSWFVIDRIGLPHSEVEPVKMYCLMSIVGVLGLLSMSMRGLGRDLAWTLLRLLGPVAWIAGIVFAAASNHGATTVIRCFLGIQLIALTGSWIVAKRRGYLTAGHGTTFARPMLSYGLPLLLAGLPSTLNLRLDQMLLATQTSADDLALYAAAVGWSSIVVPIIGSVGIALLPSLAAAAEVDKLDMARSGIHLTVAIGLLSSTVLAVLAPWAIPAVFGQAFRGEPLTAILLCVAGFFLCLNVVVWEILRGINATRQVLRSELAGLIATVALLVIFVPKWQLRGAAIASLGGYSLATFVALRYLRAKFGVSMKMLVIPKWETLQRPAMEFRALFTKLCSGRKPV